MKKRIFLYFLCIVIFCTCIGCSTISGTPNSSSKNENVSIGKHLIIKDINPNLSLQNNNDALSADGLYYATWTMGNCIDYKNADGDIIDLYDAQLYLLLGETDSKEDAEQKKNTWLAAAQNNYAISEEEDITYNNHTYTQITYNYKSKENPYSHGISAFTVYNNCAICIELTCRETFPDDLEPILTDFLNNCSYTDN